MLPVFHPESLPALCTIRLCKLLPDLEFDVKRCGWEPVAEQLRRCSTHIAMCAIKTYVNGWTTTHRFHEQARLPCIFGCRGCNDTLSHYLSCERLWRVTAKHSRIRIGTSVLDKLGLKHPQPEHFKNLAVAFNVYHALKLSNRDLIEQALGSRSFETLAQKAKQQAAAANIFLSALIPN